MRKIIFTETWLRDQLQIILFRGQFVCSSEFECLSFNIEIDVYCVRSIYIYEF